MTTTVDLGLIREVVNDTLAAINALDGTVIDDATLGNKPNHARINRELLGLADQLNFVAALVQNECWTGEELISHEL